MSVIQGSAIESSGGYQIANSVRFRASAGPSFSFTTPASGGDRDKWWIYIPFKRSKLGVLQYMHGADTASADAVFFNASDQLCVNIAGTARLVSNRVFRDPSAWGALLVVYDASNATAGLRLRVYERSESSMTFGEMSSWGTDTRSAITAGTAKTMHNSIAHVIGKNPTAASDYFDGYLTQYRIGTWSGSQPTPAALGATDGNGIWCDNGSSPSYGTSGSFLKFNDGTSATTLGYDRSGNGNNWTASGISTTAGATYDWMTDTPSVNYCVLDGLTGYYGNSSSIQDASLTVYQSIGSNGYFGRRGNFQLPLSGKWYWEVLIGTKDAAAGQWMEVGIQAALSPWPTGSGGYAYSNGFYYFNDGSKGNNNVITAYGASWTTGDVIGVAVDFDGGTIAFYKNGTSQGIAYSGLSPAAQYIPAFEFYRSTGTVQFLYPNFGQRPFTYTPPTGFKSLCTANLPAVAIPNPRAHVDVVTQLGSAVNTGANLLAQKSYTYQLAIGKDRAVSNNWQYVDTVRGSSAVLHSNDTGAETTYTAPTSGDNCVSIHLNAGTAGVTNTAGSITSTVSANTTAGFSIVTYTGNGTNNATVGHSLGITPKMVVVKSRDSGTRSWYVAHASLTANYNLLLQTTDPAYGPTSFGSGVVGGLSSTVFTCVPGSAVPNNVANINTNAEKYVAYCFAEVTGFSKFGSYTGNGSADGPFVYCGFRPRWVLVKRYDAGTTSEGWWVVDTARDTYNATDKGLVPNSSSAEGTGYTLDITALGFKVRLTGTAYNANGGTYIFAAFAEYPFGGSNVSPSPAR